MNGLKLAFGIKLDVVWTRENIWERLVEYSKINPEFKQADLVKANNLPSLPCILSYYPEYKNFSDVKIQLINDEDIDINQDFLPNNYGELGEVEDISYNIYE